MFRLARHDVVIQVLSALNRDLLNSCNCYFGGGTRIVMELDEYRESLDIDLLCADREGYRNLRAIIAHDSLGHIMEHSFPLAREVRADRYGIRTFIEVAGERIKFEIVFEGRISLAGEDVSGIPIVSLDRISCVAEKLLANADRWADQGVLSRDLIDLAFMATYWGAPSPEAFQKAEGAYGLVIRRTLASAHTQFTSDPAVQRRSCELMGITDIERLTHGLTILATCAELSSTKCC
jgi:hypothetical protein